jgi:hypothetical protein
MNILKPLMLLGVTSLLTGCFLTLDVGEGGYVESTIGYCEESSSCSYEVTDTSFDESFTAIAKGGYVFSHWRGGDGYQCPGSENPVCQVSNTQGAGNANAESIVASDADFGIVEPVFRAQRRPAPVVVDATGTVVGSLNPDGIEFLATANGTAYYLRSEPIYPRLGGNVDYAYFASSGCTGDAYFIKPPSDTIYHGIYSNGAIYGINPHAEQEMVYTQSRASSSSCAGVSQTLLVTPAVKIPVTLPLHFELR